MVERLGWSKLAQEVIAVRLVILLGFFLNVSWAFQVLRETAMVSYLEIPEKT
jgi:putative flippase GtrA